MKSIKLMVSCALLLGISVSNAQEYKEGTAIMVLDQPFASFSINNGRVQTGEYWFDDFAIRNDVFEMRQFCDGEVDAAKRFYTIHFPDTLDVASIVTELEGFGSVDAAGENWVVDLFSLNVNDTEYQNPNYTWALEKMNIESAWNYTTGNNQVVVGVVDSGIDLYQPNGLPPLTVHEEFAGKLVGSNALQYGFDFMNFSIPNFPPQEPVDKFGHGTWMSGIVGAYRNNNMGISGVAGGNGGTGGNPGVKILPVRVFDEEGKATADEFWSGIWVAAEECDILLVAGGYVVSSANMKKNLIDVLTLLNGTSDFLLIAAAGNGLKDYSYEFNDTGAFSKPVLVPAAFSNYERYFGQYLYTAKDFVISVGATNALDNKAHYSNYGKEYADIFAPGAAVFETDSKQILSTLPQNGDENDPNDPSNFSLSRSTIPGGIDNVYHPNGAPFKYSWLAQGGQDIVNPTPVNQNEIAFPSLSGTSASAAYIAGIAALIKSQDPTLESLDIQKILTSSSSEINEENEFLDQGRLGSGRIDAGKALEMTNTSNIKPNIVFEDILNIIDYVDPVNYPSVGGNGNGKIEAGETVRLIVKLKNYGGRTSFSNPNLFPIDDDTNPIKQRVSLEILNANP